MKKGWLKHHWKLFSPNWQYVSIGWNNGLASRIEQANIRTNYMLVTGSLWISYSCQRPSHYDDQSDRLRHFKFSQLSGCLIVGQMSEIQSCQIRNYYWYSACVIVIFTPVSNETDGWNFKSWVGPVCVHRVVIRVTSDMPSTHLVSVA